MRFYTKDESLEWLTGLGLTIPGYPTPWSGGNHKTSLSSLRYPDKPGLLLNVIKRIAAQIPEDPVMLLLTEWGIWKSSENEHLYYRLRQSYGDCRFYYEAPGHVFLEHERPTLFLFSS